MYLPKFSSVAELGWAITGMVFARPLTLMADAPTESTGTLILLTGTGIIVMRALEFWKGMRKIDAESDHGKLLNCQEVVTKTKKDFEDYRDQVDRDFKSYRDMQAAIITSLKDEISRLRSEIDRMRESAAVDRRLIAESVPVSALDLSKVEPKKPV